MYLGKTKMANNLRQAEYIFVLPNKNSNPILLATLPSRILGWAFFCLRPFGTQIAKHKNKKKYRNCIGMDVKNK